MTQTVGYGRIMPVHKAPSKAAITVGGWLSIPRGQLFALGKGAVLMITLSEVILLLSLIVDIVTLVIYITKKK